MRKQELLAKIRSTREEFEALIAQLSPEQLTQPGVAGDWSVKDMLAHIAWYETQEAEFYAEVDLEGSPLWKTPQDPRNELIVEQNRDRSLLDVLNDFRTAHDRILEVMTGLTEEDLSTPGRFPDTSEEWPPWRKIAVHSCDHDREHIDMIRTWLRDADVTVSA